MKILKYLKSLISKKELRIWHISDTHTHHELLEIPKGIDIVIHSGDFAHSRDVEENILETLDFLEWFGNLPIKYKIAVAGNHDVAVEKKRVIPSMFAFYGVTYLEDEYVTIEGITIFGTPYTPSFGNWSFQKARGKIFSHWKKVITKYADIIICHGPPKGVLDLSYARTTMSLEYCGDSSIMKHLKFMEPVLFLFGHIHNCEDIVNQGTRTLGDLDTIFSNGSIMKDGRFGVKTSNGTILTIPRKS